MRGFWEIEERDQGRYPNLGTGKRWRPHFEEPEGGPLVKKPVRISANGGAGGTGPFIRALSPGHDYSEGPQSVSPLYPVGHSFLTSLQEPIWRTRCLCDTKPVGTEEGVCHPTACYTAVTPEVTACSCTPFNTLGEALRRGMLAT